MTPITPSPQQLLAGGVQELNDRYWDDEVMRCASHRVILVEGDDDRDALKANAEQWARGVRGKSVFSAVLVLWLNARYGQRSARQWLGERAPGLAAAPKPFEALFGAVL